MTDFEEIHLNIGMGTKTLYTIINNFNWFINANSIIGYEKNSCNEYQFDEIIEITELTLTIKMPNTNPDDYYESSAYEEMIYKDKLWIEPLYHKICSDVMHEMIMQDTKLISN